MPRKQIKEVTAAAHKVSAAFAGMGLRTLREEFAPPRVVETDFVQLDHVTRVNGFPLGRMVIVHGPSNEGKTMFTLGLVRSFVGRGHPAFYVDSEFTLDTGYAGLICGPSVTESGLFLGKKPDNYEQVVDLVADFCRNVQGMAEENPEQGAIIVIDSLKKLTPKNLLAKMFSDVDSKRSIDGAGGRGGQMKAAINGQWSDQLIPMLHKSNTTIVLIGRESSNPEASAPGASFSAVDDFVLGGGKNIYFDSSLVLRVEVDSKIGTAYNRETKSGGLYYGDRHKVTIRKTKLSSKKSRRPVCYFHSSNGEGPTPAGLDRGRDVLQLATTFGLVHKSGSWFSVDGIGRWQGEHAAAKALHENPEQFVALERKVRSKFAQHEIETEDGVIE